MGTLFMRQPAEKSQVLARAEGRLEQTLWHSMVDRSEPSCCGKGNTLIVRNRNIWSGRKNSDHLGKTGKIEPTM
jgi:hypothetical protein